MAETDVILTSAALGYRNALDLGWATAIAFLIGDPAATLELGRTAIRRPHWGVDRLRDRTGGSAILTTAYRNC